ncbi:hypothetical protein NXS08_03190 [Gleimia sp. 6138-11-ORH1]|uniref:hypothetical protein n=1 Tax=Gleimia sp. 6138-11-ORH1 TaxID=2973937 RepID=UPI0021690CF3|nr:hypothetical protein [Gleimia sp. 6138-11-ORH1]MCS4484493.1 hypothetical protein [Gleimia sp. 6138-11-ORH1]
MYERYRELSHRLPHRLRWLSYVCAPWRFSFIVLLAGFVAISGALMVTLGVSLVGSPSVSKSTLAALLIGGFIAESFGYWVKERWEFILTFTVRQLVYRRFKDVFELRSTREDRGNVLTYPGQISQFAYVVDSVLSTVNVVAFLVLALVLYGWSGLVASIIITGLVAASVVLINRIGNLWEQYVELEGKRRHWIQLLGQAMPRGPLTPRWDYAIGQASHIRETEEGLLKKRVRLQIFSGFLDSSSLTFTLCVVAILGAWFWPQGKVGIGIILAARYLYSAVQNNLVNYRVIRLAVPMMKDLDKLENDVLDSQAQTKNDGTSQPASSVEIVDRSTPYAQELLTSAVHSQTAFIPRNPQMAQIVLTAWKAAASAEKLSRFDSHAAALGLGREVLGRVWQDVTTLSSGETHRLALAMVLADQPQWLILDDTFAALDPRMREVAARHVAQAVPHCSIIAASHEYVPAVFLDAAALPAHLSEETSGVPATELSQSAVNVDQLPDPDPKQAMLWKTVALLFGPHIISVIIGALALTCVEIVFALTLSNEENLTAHLAIVSAVCVLVIVVGCVVFFGTIYRVPITRLGDLHRQLLARFDQFASRNNSGAIVGRMGDDFSDLQMNIPAALGSVFRTVSYTVLLVGASAVGAPIFLIVILAIMPLAYLAYRQGSKRVIASSTEVANKRGEFLGAVSVQAGLHTSISSPSFYQAGQAAYAEAESNYIKACIGVADAYAWRDGLIQALVLSLNSAAVVVAVLLGMTSSSFVAPVAVLYFAVTLSSGIRSTIETLQNVDVVGLTVERVRLLETLTVERSLPPVRQAELDKVIRLLNSGRTMIALIGATGAGKSVILESLARRYLSKDVCLIPDTDPFAEEESPTSGIDLVREELAQGRTPLILLDETFKPLMPAQEREELVNLSRSLTEQNRQAIVVLHSRSNLDMFADVIELGN